MLSDGDWVEGEVKWWWKYVFPRREQFWLNILVQRLDPQPDPWLQAVTGEILEGVAMLHAAARIGDEAIKSRLKNEAANKIADAAKSLQQG